jgi:hypothetical protein
MGEHGHAVRGAVGKYFCEETLRVFSATQLDVY